VNAADTGFPVRPGTDLPTCIGGHDRIQAGYTRRMPALSNARPPTPLVEVQRWVLDSYPQLRSLRSSLHTALTGEPLPDGRFLGEVPDNVAVVASELATNALVHARPPTVVRLCRTDTSFILDVADEVPTKLPQFAGGRPRGAGGLGLQLARRLTLDIGWYVDGDVKHVWAQFLLPATP
jgi:serine/threonine-protein kinase RsbW